MELQVDPFLFQARENGVSYTLIEERIQAPRFNTHPGVRGKLAVALSHDCWVLSAELFHYHARTREKLRGAGSPTWGIADPFSEVSSLWRLHMGIGSLSLSRGWWVSNSLCLTPLFGLSYVVIRHKLMIVYDVLDLSMKDKFWGVGPLFGGRGVWELWEGFSLYTSLGMSLSYGEDYLHQDQAKEVRLYDGYRRLQPSFEGSLGLRWVRCCFFAQVGFEIHLFPNVNQLLQFADGVLVGKVCANQGDLSLHGLSLALGVDF